MYAGFWRRSAAAIIDGFILYLGSIAFFLFIGLLGYVLKTAGMNEWFFQNVLVVYFVLFYLSSTWLYYALFESSKYRATPGKMMIELVVVDRNMRQLSFSRATARYWSKLLSHLLMMIGLLIAAFDEKKRSLHDFMAGTYVLKKAYLSPPMSAPVQHPQRWNQGRNGGNPFANRDT